MQPNPSPKASAQHTLHYVVCNDREEYFHFWDRANYGEPQFGDLHGAKRYTSLGGCLARVRALHQFGYAVAYHSDRTEHAS